MATSVNLPNFPEFDVAALGAEETCDIFKTLTIPGPTEGTNVFKICVKSLAEYFEPQKCVDHHIYVNFPM